jgi:hypothetical protein
MTVMEYQGYRMPVAKNMRLQDYELLTAIATLSSLDGEGMVAYADCVRVDRRERQPAPAQTQHKLQRRRKQVDDPPAQDSDSDRYQCSKSKLGHRSSVIISKIIFFSYKKINASLEALR